MCLVQVDELLNTAGQCIIVVRYKISSDILL